MFAATVEGIASRSHRQGVGQEPTLEGVCTGQNKLTGRFKIHAGLFFGEEQFVLFKRLDSKTAAAGMTLNTPDIAISLGEIYRLNFILEIIEIQLNAVLLRQGRRAEQS
jgi:hypothetical protein